MRFIAFIKGNKDSEAGKLPSPELIEAMGKLNEEMVKAGVMVGGEGLHPSSKGAKLKFSAKGKVHVVDGPFTEAKELVAGFWILEVKSKQEAIDWLKRVALMPNDGNEEGEIELRQIFDPADFPSDVLPPEQKAKEEALRAEIEKRAAKK
jgi:hypothetical protein